MCPVSDAVGPGDMGRGPDFINTAAATAGVEPPRDAWVICLREDKDNSKERPRLDRSVDEHSVRPPSARVDSGPAELDNIASSVWDLN